MYLYESVCKTMSVCVRMCTHEGHSVLVTMVTRWSALPWVSIWWQWRKRKRVEMGRYRETTSFVCLSRPSNNIFLNCTFYNVITSSVLEYIKIWLNLVTFAVKMLLVCRSCHRPTLNYIILYIAEAFSMYCPCSMYRPPSYQPCSAGFSPSSLGPYSKSL